MSRSLGFAGVLFFLSIGSVFAQDKLGNGNTLTVHGLGTVVATPDRATIRAGVVTQTFTAAQGLADNANVMNRVVNGLRRFGIQKKDVQTQGFSVAPLYARQGKNSTLVQRISGYRVINNVTITMSNVYEAGKLVDALVQQGINRIDGISFSLQNRDQLSDTARRKAVDNARRKAVLYAKEAGVTLGRVLKISDGEAVPTPRRAGLAATRMVANVPVEPGSLEIIARVRVTYEIK